MSSSSDKILGFLAGAATGAVLGMLFAPEKGDKLRSMIKDEALKASDKLKSEASTIGETLKDKYLNAGETLESKLDHLLDSTADTADYAITALEKKLEVLRKEALKLKKQS